MWSVCLTSKGVLNYLNRRISPVGMSSSPSESFMASCCCPLVNVDGKAGAQGGAAQLIVAP